MSKEERAEWLLSRFDWYFWDSPVRSDYLQSHAACLYLCRLLRTLPQDVRDRMLDAYRTSVPRKYWLQFEGELLWVR